MTTTMASHSLLPHLLPLLAILFARILASNTSVKASLIYPFNCDARIKTCNASLYHMNNWLSEEQIASFYSVNLSQMEPIMHGNKQDYLIRVPCSCTDINGTRGYFYNTSYPIKQNDSFDNVSADIYSGQAWSGGSGNDSRFDAGTNFSIHLPCGCVDQSDSLTVITYTVQDQDTVAGIAALLSAQESDIQRLNRQLTGNLAFIAPGWVLFVPMEKNGIPAPKKGELLLQRYDSHLFEFCSLCFS
jgi:hypothetical protein